MAFTVEDGTIVEDANSLCSVEFADAYFTDRGVTTWTGADSAKESALIRATDFMEIRYADLWLGDRLDAGQALSFPRTDIEQDDVVPVAVQKACAEYALRTLDGTPLAPDPQATETGRLALIAESHKVGPLEDTYRYASRGAGVVQAAFRPYPAADALLKGLLPNTRGVLR